MIMFSLTSFKLHLTTQIMTEVDFHHQSPHQLPLEVMLIIVPIKEALEFEKYFVQAFAKFSVARMV